MLISLEKSLKRFFLRLINVPVNLIEPNQINHQKWSTYFRV
jgi:hypothetical protein